MVWCGERVREKRLFRACYRLTHVSRHCCTCVRSTCIIMLVCVCVFIVHRVVSYQVRFVR